MGCPHTSLLLAKWAVGVWFELLILIGLARFRRSLLGLLDRFGLRRLGFHPRCFAGPLPIFLLKVCFIFASDSLQEVDPLLVVFLFYNLSLGQDFP